MEFQILAEVVGSKPPIFQSLRLGINPIFDSLRLQSERLFDRTFGATSFSLNAVQDIMKPEKRPLVLFGVTGQIGKTGIMDEVV